MNTINTRFAGFNVQLSESVTSEDRNRISKSLKSQIANTLQITDPSSIKISFPELSLEKNESPIQQLSDSTDLVEFEITSEENASVAQVWNWTYRISEYPDVAYVEPRIALLDPTRLKGILPENTQFPVGTDVRTWHLTQTEVQRAWSNFFSESEPGRGIKIALPDTGYLFHPALNKVLFESETRSAKFAYDFVDPDNLFPGKGWTPGSDPNPIRFGHGVSTSALIFAPNENDNVPGIAPYAEPLFLRVARSDRDVKALEFFAPPLGAAIHYAVNNNAHIISISMGGYPTLPVRRAILNALRKGIIVIASAGNDVPFTVWPGAYRQVIAVASSAVDGSIANRSAKGTRINIAAPGEYVWCAVSRNFNEHSFERRSGTSFATPIVAGIAALWLSRWGVDYLFNEKYKDRPELIPIVFNKLLREQCSTPEGWDKEHWGAGIVNAFKLLNAKLPDIADLTNQELDVINRSDYPELDQGGVSTFNHLFEHVQSSKGLMELALAKLVGKPREELPEFLRQFGRELAFHFGINKSLYGLLENILSQVEQEIDLITPSIETSLDEVRTQLKGNASQALQGNLL
jgi:serine protease